MFLEQPVDAGDGILLVSEDVVGISDGAAGDEVVGCGGKLVGRRTRYADIEFEVELA